MSSEKIASEKFKRTLAVLPTPGSNVDSIQDFSHSEKLEKSLAQVSKSHTFLSARTPTQLLKELDELDAELVLLAPPQWEPSTKAIEDLIFGYEMGSRVIIARRPATALPPRLFIWLQKTMLYVLFGTRRQDPDTPLRLYDKEAFMHILGVFAKYDDTLPAELYLLTAVEHYFTFGAVGVAVQGWSENDENDLPVNFEVMEMLRSFNAIKDAIRKYRVEAF